MANAYWKQKLRRLYIVGCGDGCTIGVVVQSWKSFGVAHAKTSDAATKEDVGLHGVEWPKCGDSRVRFKEPCRSLQEEDAGVSALADDMVGAVLARDLLRINAKMGDMARAKLGYHCCSRRRTGIL